MALKSMHLVLLGVAAVTLVEAAEYVKPNLKPGLWEVTNHPQISGDSPLAAEQLAKLTPEQRAHFEAAMSKRNEPKTYKECMTPEKIAHGFDMDPHGEEAAGCKRTVVSSTASELTLHDECKKPDRQSVSDVHFEIKGATLMNGKVNVVSTSNGKTMKIDSTISGKWLAADCGSVKDAELEK